VASRPSGRRSRLRTAPIDPQAVALVEGRLLRGRLGHDHELLLTAACNITRMRIVRALAETPLAASDLARVVGRTPAATSQHLRVLRDVNAIEPTRSGNIVRYRLTQDVSARILITFARSFDAAAE